MACTRIEFILICTFVTLCGVSSKTVSVLENEVINETLEPNKITESCVHKGDVWECCVEIDRKLNLTCLSVEYLRKEIGLELNITVAGVLILNRKVSVRNPPPICAAIPYLEKIADACFSFHDLDEVNKTLHACVRFEGHVEGFKVFKFELGCFDIPLLFMDIEKKPKIEEYYTVEMMQRANRK